MKIFILSCFLVFQFAHSQKNIYSKQLNADEQYALKSYFEENYGVAANAPYIVVHYIQPEKYCHYNKYEDDPLKSAAWFEKFYQDNKIVFPVSTKKLYSFYESRYTEKRKATPYVQDKNHVLHKLIMSIKKIETCEALLMFGPNGKLIVKYGETSPDDFKYIIKKIQE
ncbi:hypothetical protein LRS05_14125 [Flavobacterium sp. J372]|uniref:hypothetical protein n=1 Tax=Flavobacterium sp. J372 TaxID=2898436 RepID=UPI002150B232|nr:hypothetical protein [Flavobacterium sp. J372]MCR5863193.1 hypothetical protein [Flavobacterium sp. J372]